MSETINKTMTLDLNIDREGLLQLADAIRKLADAPQAGVGIPTSQQPVPAPLPNAVCQAPVPTAAPVSQAPMSVPTTTHVPGQEMYPAASQAPMPGFNQMPVPVAAQQVSTPTMPVVPTTAVVQEYTQDQLAVACAGLVNQGKQPRLMQILQGFGVASLIELPKERYGDLATALRAEGAVI